MKQHLMVEREWFEGIYGEWWKFSKFSDKIQPLPASAMFAERMEEVLRKFDDQLSGEYLARGGGNADPIEDYMEEEMTELRSILSDLAAAKGQEQG